MKKIYNILKVVLYCIVGNFLGSSFYQYYDYKMHPDVYIIRSAPWYLSIQISAVFAILSMALIFAIMAWIKKKSNR